MNKYQVWYGGQTLTNMDGDVVDDYMVTMDEEEVDDYMVTIDEMTERAIMNWLDERTETERKEIIKRLQQMDDGSVTYISDEEAV